MSLYPCLEDMKVDHMQQAQTAHAQAMHNTAHAITAPQGVSPTAPGAPPPYSPPGMSHSGSAGSLYPSLDEYMGLSPELIEKNMALVVALPENKALACPSDSTSSSSYSSALAPVTGMSVGIRRAEIKQGVRHVTLCKDGKGKMGLRVRSINKGVFVAFVHKDSPSALAGLRFGDQILQINGENVAGWDTDKAMKYLSKCDPQSITMAVRDRPFERTITMVKDSSGHIGFVFKDGKITAIVKDSSAARNGVLTDHQLVEINGQNCVGVKDKEIGQIIENSGNTITITIIPTFLYDHMIKSIGSSLIKKFMDHSVPDI